MKHFYILFLIFNFILPCLNGEVRTSTDSDRETETVMPYDRDVTKAIHGIDRRRYYKQFQSGSTVHGTGTEAATFSYLYGGAIDVEGVEQEIYLGFYPGEVYIFKYQVRDENKKITKMMANFGKWKLQGTKIKLDGLGEIVPTEFPRVPRLISDIKVANGAIRTRFILNFMDLRPDPPGSWIDDARRFNNR